MEPIMKRTLKIRDVTLRDGQQSQFATRMNKNQVEQLLPLYREANFYALEVWGGAVPDSIMRYLGENPWQRLEMIRDGVQKKSKLTALSRGRNLFGYTPYPDTVIEGFIKHALESGIDIMRIFDALNDIENMRSSIDFVKKYGGIADCAVCYTVDPHFSLSSRFHAFIKGKKLPQKLFTIKYFVEKAKELEKAGADIITIKDMAGLIDPATSDKLIQALKNEIGVPVNLHTHCTPGFGTASLLMAIINNVDIVDTAVLNFSGGPAAPGYEIIQLFADLLDIDTGVNKTVVAQINSKLRVIRKELEKFDEYKLLPPDIDIATFKPDAELSALFHAALEAAQKHKTQKVLDYCQKIEKAFNYPEPNKIVQKAQIPGGMYTNMLAQLKELKLEKHTREVLEMVPQVRLDSGIPPLVTPTSQIVGVQAVNCVVDKTQGKPMYSNVSKNFLELVKGSYGTTPWPIDPEFREKIAGTREPIPYDVSKYKPQPNPILQEYGNVQLAVNEKEQLLLELFPQVADKFLRETRKKEYEEQLKNVPEKPELYPIEFWEYLLEHMET